MTQREMFEKSFQRPCNYFELSGEDQWAIDKDLGILDWDGRDLSEADKTRFKKHYKKNSCRRGRRPTKPTPKKLSSIVTVKPEKITKNIFAMTDIEY